MRLLRPFSSSQSYCVLAFSTASVTGLTLRPLAPRGPGCRRHARRRSGEDLACRRGRGACARAPSCRRRNPRVERAPPFSAPFALCASRIAMVGLAFAAGPLARLDVEHVVDAGDRAVPLPQIEVVPDRAARRQIGRDRVPLAPRHEHVEDGVQDLAKRRPNAGGAALRRSDQRCNEPPIRPRSCRLNSATRADQRHDDDPAPHARRPPRHALNHNRILGLNLSGWAL